MMMVQGQWIGAQDMVDGVEVMKDGAKAVADRLGRSKAT
jgi:hypothetical protein